MEKTKNHWKETRGFYSIKKNYPNKLNELLAIKSKLFNCPKDLSEVCKAKIEKIDQMVENSSPEAVYEVALRKCQNYIRSREDLEECMSAHYSIEQMKIQSELDKANILFRNLPSTSI